MPSISSSFGKIIKKNNIYGNINGSLIISSNGNGIKKITIHSNMNGSLPISLYGNEIKKAEKIFSGENHKTCDHPDILKPMHECAYCGGGGCSHC